MFRKRRIHGPLKPAREEPEESVDRTRFRRGICQNIPQESQHVRDAEGLLETNRLVAARSSGSAFEQIAGHIDQHRLLLSRSFEDAAGSLAAIYGVAARGEVQVAEKHVIAGAPKMCESLLGSRGTVYSQALGR